MGSSRLVMRSTGMVTAVASRRRKVRMMKTVMWGSETKSSLVMMKLMPQMMEARARRV